MTDTGSPLVPPRDGQLTPDAIAERSFATAKRGYAESEVRAFLHRVADEVAALTGREKDLAYRVTQLEQEANKPPPPLSDQQLISALGEETARVLGQAREAAVELRNKAEEHARRLVREAQESARELRTSAQQALEVKTREAEDSARARANEIVGEARTLRERVLADLSERRQELERQVAELRSSRGKLVDAYELVERTLGQATKLMEQETPLQRATPGVEAPRDAPVDQDGDDRDDDDAVPDQPDDAATEPEPKADSTSADESDAGSKDVGALFDQLRSVAGTDVGAPEADAGGDAAPGFEAAIEVDEEGQGEEEEEEEAAGAEPATGDQGLLDARDRALAEAQEELTRRAKRALQDEQNDILDGVRRQRGKIDPAKVLPTLDEQLARWAHVLQPAIDQAYAVGASTAARTKETGTKGTGAKGSSAGRAPASVLADLSSVVVAPLRDRLSSTLSEIDERTPADTEIAIAQRLGARYREWRSQHLEPMLGDVLSAAHARGTYDAAPADVRLRWVPVQVGKCPDCDDNALEPTVRGNDFPTGQQYPPAHPGCRCLLVVDTDSDSDSATGTGTGTGTDIGAGADGSP